MTYPEFPLSKDILFGYNNQQRTTSLVLETCKQGDSPIFTVSFVRDDYIPLGKLFVELTIDDPTETVFAETILGQVSYWKKMREANSLKPYVEEWREIADAKRKQLAFEALIQEVKNDGKSSVSAAKYLIEEPWKDKRDKKTREQVKKTTQEAYTQIADDIERVKDFLQ